MKNPARSCAALSMFFALLVSGGCTLSPMNGVMASWEGAPIDEVFTQWGSPTQISGVPGPRQYLWHEDTGGVYTYGGLRLLDCTRILEVDDRDTVRGWSWTGNGCQSAVSDLSKWARKTNRN